jgi:hypothetical protein
MDFATVDADPLWLLYYKRMLKPITEFPDNPQNFIEWRLKDQQTYETLNTTGTLKRLQEELDLIKEKYSLSARWICRGKTLHYVSRNANPLAKICSGTKEVQ